MLCFISLLAIRHLCSRLMHGLNLLRGPTLATPGVAIAGSTAATFQILSSSNTSTAVTLDVGELVVRSWPGHGVSVVTGGLLIASQDDAVVQIVAAEKR
jgi:hypothetical protein